MSDASSRSTFRPPSAEIVRVCLIHTDERFCDLLRNFLDDDPTGVQATVAIVNEIPQPNEMEAEIVLFDPTLPDCAQADSVERMRQAFGEEVKPVALVRDGQRSNVRYIENLTESGVCAAVSHSDISAIAKLLHMLTLGVETPAIKAHNTSVTPLRPERMPVHICIIAADREFAQRLTLVLKRDLNLKNEHQEMALIEGDFDHIPDIEETNAINEMQLVIFDPEMDEFRNLAAGLDQLKSAIGPGAMYVARTDHWEDANNRLTKQLKELGVKAGCAREDYKGFSELASKLRDGIHPEFITL
jgi:hypothetical protein